MEILNMKTINSIFRLTAALVLGVVLVGCASAPAPHQTRPDAELSFDGLHKVDNSQADVAWARPDFDISGYSKLLPVSAGIEYRQVKDRGRSMSARSQGGPYFIDEQARREFEALVTEIFTEELQKLERFEIVDEPGPDVLIIHGGLLDVTSYVPPEPIGGRSYVYLSAVGEAALVLELRDSETGTILARSVDRRAAETIGDSVSLANYVTNSAETTRLIRHWATRLREGLDGFGQ
jgi:hypothetical protein